METSAVSVAQLRAANIPAARRLCAAFTMVIGWVGCGRETVLSPNTEVLSDDVAKSATVGPGVLIFPKNSSTNGLVDSEGKILVSQVGEGFLRLVTGAKSEGEKIILATEEAALPDAVEDGVVDATFDLATGKPMQSPAAAEPQDASASPGTFSYDLSGTQIWADESQGVRITIPSGSIQFAPKLDVQTDISNNATNSARFVARGALTLDMEVEVRASGEFQTGTEIKLLSAPCVPIAITVGTLKVCPVLKAGFELNASGAIRVTTGVHATANVSFGIEYLNGRWESDHTISPQWDFSEPTFGSETELHAKVYVRGELDLRAGGVVASAKLGIKPYARVEANLDGSWGLFGGVEGDYEISALAGFLKIADNKADPWKIFEKQLLPNSASDELPLDSGDCSDGDENGLETGVDCGGLNTDCSDGCPLGAESCVSHDDCESDLCDQGTCLDAACADDCGGICLACAGDGCSVDSDCSSGACSSGECDAPYYCGDGELDYDETDVDCGGPVCGPCGPDGACADDGDCDGASCSNGVCESVPLTCGDGTCDADEDGDSCPDDCGGSSCGDGTCEADETDGDCPDDCGCASNEVVTCDDPDPAPSGCYCDPVCAANGDCCADACDICGSCGGPVCGDGVCDQDETDSDCPEDCGCSSNEVVNCDDAAPAPGGCYCDPMCVDNSDCCSDACAVCGSC